MASQDHSGVFAQDSKHWRRKKQGSEFFEETENTLDLAIKVGLFPRSSVSKEPQNSFFIPNPSCLGHAAPDSTRSDLGGSHLRNGGGCH